MDRAAQAAALSLHVEDEDQRNAILHELEEILASRFFRKAARGSQFLRFIVEKKLANDDESLKERSIGIQLFRRPADYATGEDPVVRVQAGEVRRRLDQYYQECETASTVRIELPLGSYAPEFHWRSAMDSASETRRGAALIETELEPQAQAHLSQRAALPTVPVRQRPGWRLWLFLCVAATSLVVLAGVGYRIYRAQKSQGMIEQFWKPIFTSQQPVLICLAKGVSYRPTIDLYRKYEQTYPGTFSNETARSNNPLPLDGNEKLTWNQLSLFEDYGLAVGDVEAAIKLSEQMGRFNKATQVRIGSNYNLDDLRNAPSVIVGAFNNRWTMNLTSNLHYVFVDAPDGLTIREQQKGGRIWRSREDPVSKAIVDYAVVSRLLDSNTGQFTMVVAGLGGKGTEAAGLFVTNPKLLEKGLRALPADWQSKNLQVVLKTIVTDSIPAPPSVEAWYLW